MGEQWREQWEEQSGEQWGEQRGEHVDLDFWETYKIDVAIATMHATQSYDCL